MLSISIIFAAAVVFFIVLTVWSGVKVVPQQEAWVLERLGKYDRTLQPGLNYLLPYVERVAYKHTLKEDAVNVAEQTAITADNVTLQIDGVLYVRIIDPVAASYGVTNPYFAVTQLAQTTMRSEIGKMTMDKTFEERELMNTNIVRAINEAASDWGIQCMRYEIKDINPPATVLKAMELQVAAERQKRAQILESEGGRQAQINRAEGEKQETVLRSEAAYTNSVNRAKGDAEQILLVADATAKSIRMVGEAISSKSGEDAVSLRVAEHYITAFGELAKTSTTVIMPADAGDAGGMIAKAIGIYDTIKRQKITS